MFCYLPIHPAREHAQVASQAFYFAATWTYGAGHVTRPGTKPGKEQVARYMPRFKCFGHSSEAWGTSPGARPLPRRLRPRAPPVKRRFQLQSRPAQQTGVTGATGAEDDKDHTMCSQDSPHGTFRLQICTQSHHVPVAIHGINNGGGEVEWSGAGVECE